MDIEDLSQDVYVQVVRNLHVLRHPETFESWIVKICQRLSINFSARKKLRATQQLPFLPESDEVVVYDESPTSLEVLLGDECQSLVRSAMNGLVELDRRMIERFYFQGCSIRDLMHEESVPSGTIRRRLHTARERIRNQLGGYFDINYSTAPAEA